MSEQHQPAQHLVQVFRHKKLQRGASNFVLMSMGKFLLWLILLVVCCPLR
jgi:hypothetical protein